MSLPQKTLERLPRIKQGLLTGETITQIAEACNVRDKTIDRDLREFRQNGNFEDWLKEEWMRLHLIVLRHDPVEAYQQVTRLLGNALTRKIEAHTIEEIKIDEKHVSIIADYTAAVEQAVQRDLTALRARQQVDTAQTNTETS
jgi:hypothetical protein